MNPKIFPGNSCAFYSNTWFSASRCTTRVAYARNIYQLYPPLYTNNTTYYIFSSPTLGKIGENWDLNSYHTKATEKVVYTLIANTGMKSCQTQILSLADINCHMKPFLSNSSLRHRTRSWLCFPPSQQVTK